MRRTASTQIGGGSRRPYRRSWETCVSFTIRCIRWRPGVGVARWECGGAPREKGRPVCRDLLTVCGDPAGARKRLVVVATDTTTVESQIVPAHEKVKGSSRRKVQGPLRGRPPMGLSQCYRVHSESGKRTQGPACRSSHSVVSRRAHCAQHLVVPSQGRRDRSRPEHDPKRGHLRGQASICGARRSLEAHDRRAAGELAPARTYRSGRLDLHREGFEGGSSGARDHRARSDLATFRESRRRDRRSPGSLNLGAI